jgi:hypothetical protein
MHGELIIFLAFAAAVTGAVLVLRWAVGDRH